MRVSATPGGITPGSTGRECRLEDGERGEADRCERSGQIHWAACSPQVGTGARHGEASLRSSIRSTNSMPLSIERRSGHAAATFSRRSSCSRLSSPVSRTSTAKRRGVERWSYPRSPSPPEVPRLCAGVHDKRDRHAGGERGRKQLVRRRRALTADELGLIRDQAVSRRRSRSPAEACRESSGLWR